MRATFRDIGNVTTAAMALLVIALYAGFGRPIWIDEFLHFALGGYDSVLDVLAVIRKTTTEVNHGQTGTYMLLDYLLLEIFGATAVALRLPSLLSGIFLLLSAFLFFKARRIGFIGRIGFLLAIVGQADLMHYVGEARPYMPLAASAVGVLAYYLVPPEDRGRRTVAVTGWVSVLLGASMHPYFPAYWFSIALFCYWSACFDGRRTASIPDALAFVNLPLSIAGTALVFGIGALTWLRDGPSFAFDPFEWMAFGLWATFTGLSHFQFIPDHALAFIVAAGVVPLLYLAAPRWAKPVLHGLVAPCVLILLALALSVLVGAASYVRHYWILPRQWVASAALVPIGVVWLACEVSRQFGRLSPLAAGAFAAAALYGLSLTTLPVMQAKAVELQGRMAPPPVPLAVMPPPPESAPSDNDGWVALANRNIEAGGPVWTIFRLYYIRGY